MTSHRNRHRQHANPFSIRGELAAPAWEAIYGRSAPMALDVGFGPGQFLLQLAQAHPEWNVLGFEIRDHFVEGVLKEAKGLNLANLHAMLANANTHGESLLPDRSLVFVSVNFPDPWFKKRHQKRRVIRADWLDSLRPKLQEGAELHIMTDYEPIGIEALELLQSRDDFSAVQRDDFLPLSTTGLRSEREETHQQRGDPVYRLHYRFVAPS